MQYLLPPKPGQTSASVSGFPQVNAGSDGLFLVENPHHASALIEIGFRYATAEHFTGGAPAFLPGDKPTDPDADPDDGEDDDGEGDESDETDDSGDDEDEEVDEDAIDLSALKKDDVKLWLDNREIEYPAGAKVDELREIALKAQAEILAAREEETEDEE